MPITVSDRRASSHSCCFQGQCFLCCEPDHKSQPLTVSPLLAVFVCRGTANSSCGAVAFDVFTDGSSSDLTRGINISDTTTCGATGLVYNASACPSCSLEALSLLPGRLPTLCLPGIYNFTYLVSGKRDHTSSCFPSTLAQPLFWSEFFRMT